MAPRPRGDVARDLLGGARRPGHAIGGRQPGHEAMLVNLIAALVRGAERVVKVVDVQLVAAVHGLQPDVGVQAHAVAVAVTPRDDDLGLTGRGLAEIVVERPRGADGDALGREAHLDERLTRQSWVGNVERGRGRELEQGGHRGRSFRCSALR